MKRIVILIFSIVISSLLMESTAMIRKRNEEILFQQDHIDNVNRTIAEKFSKTNCYDPNKNYRYINILYVGYIGNGFDKNQVYEDFPDNFYSIFIRGKGKTRYLFNIALVCEEDGKLVAFVSEYGGMSCVSQYKESVFYNYQKLAYLLLGKEITILFNFFPMSGHRYLGIDNNGNKYLINEEINPITISPFEEITDEEWKNSVIPIYYSK